MLEKNDLLDKIETMDDDELFDIMKKELYTGVLTDIMDTMDLRHQFLPAYIQPLNRDMMVAGRAFTVQEADVTGTRICAENREKPFGIMFEALDAMKKNDVYICTGSSPKYACFGGLMSTRMIKLGVAGAVVSGYTRDTKEVLSLGLPTFTRGCYAQDQGMRGRVIDYNCPIEFENGVLVNPGDIIFGDIDGVLSIPKKQEREIIRKAFEKVYGENEVRIAIENGMSVVEAFDKYGIM
ncbi:RraA family protein [Vallitalea maricola]|uniref:RraA family protein n=1 Tax=Vallitalea maricola TaxID=3074433 RepID=A0ACB5UNM7_9FIRM|nr:RraA family protein [Vallitalea sp. AN17-2]